MIKLARAVSLAGLARGAEHPWAGSARRAIDWAAAIGARAVQLDVTAPGIRPRELDGVARRDLVAVMRRAGLTCSGLDAFIPAHHFTDPANVDRALGALLQAIELAADLARIGGARIPVCATLPEKLPDDVLTRLALGADHHGVPLADLSWPPREARGNLGPGIDPAAAFAGGGDPCRAVVRMNPAPAAARLSDVSGAGRCEPGAGRLDVLEYEVSLVTAGFGGALVIDLRGLARQEAAARAQLKV